MNKSICLSLFVFLSNFLTSCNSSAQLSDRMEANSVNQERLTQFQLDAAFRRQSIINESTSDPTNNYAVCCVVFHADIEMLTKVFAHFRENTNQDSSVYGALVQETENEYVVHLGERFREENQFFSRDTWWPGTSETPLPTYRYRIDRETLEIKDFQEFPE